MSTPIPRTSSAIIASGFQAVPEGFRAFAGILERELTALTTERDELRADCENETKWAAHYLAQSKADKARAERAEDNLAALEQCHDDNCRGLAKIADDLTAERARLDWLQEHALAQHSEGISISKLGKHYNGFPGSLRAAIDAAMKGEA